MSAAHAPVTAMSITMDYALVCLDMISTLTLTLVDYLALLMLIEILILISVNVSMDIICKAIPVFLRELALGD